MSMRVIDLEATSINIKELMASKGYNPREIQMELELESVQTVYKWINQKYKSLPSLDNMIMLAHLFDCSVEDILVTCEQLVEEGKR